MRRTRVATTVTAIALCIGALSIGTTACTSLATPPGQPATPAPAATSSADMAVRLSGEKAVPKPLVGVDLYVDQNYSRADAGARGRRDLAYIAGTLRLKAVALVWDYEVPGPSSDAVAASPSRTPTIADLAELTSIARSDGLRVEYRVLFAVGGPGSRYKSVRPRNLTAWLRSLLAAETPALRLAQADHVSEFVAGTEMAEIDQSPLWGAFFAKAARLYHGILSYAQWGGQGVGSRLGGFFSPRRVLLPEQYFGASAYPPVNLPPTASVAQLTKAWVAFLRQAPERLLHLTAIDATAIPAVAGAYRDPYQWNGLRHARPDLAIQANWYRAACQAADLVHVRALYFWGAVLSSSPASAQSPLVGFEGHPAAEAAIRSCQ